MRCWLTLLVIFSTSSKLSSTDAAEMSRGILAKLVDNVLLVRCCVLSQLLLTSAAVQAKAVEIEVGLFQYHTATGPEFR
jgi:hypothetical protein